MPREVRRISGFEKERPPRSGYKGKRVSQKKKTKTAEQREFLSKPRSHQFVQRSKRELEEQKKENRQRKVTWK